VTLDEVGWREMARRDRAHYDALKEAEWREECAIDADQDKHNRWMRRQATEIPDVHYATPTDRRLFAVDGDLVEQSRRDAEVPPHVRGIACPEVD
jgi:hypothetical protein